MSGGDGGERVPGGAQAPLVAAAGAASVDGGDLPLGPLLALVRPALDRLAPGGVLAVLSTAKALRDDLPTWCRLEHHDYLERRPLDASHQRHIDCHLVARGRLSAPRGQRDAGRQVALTEGLFSTPELLAVAPFPVHAEVTSGFAPRGALVEPGSPAFPFTLVDEARVAPPEVAALYDQAVATQWDGSVDIPWAKLPALPAPLEQAVGQIMTFLAENELAALYVPARFLPRIHPAYVETAQFLATQIADEARHVSVFTKRARAGGGTLGISSVSSMRSLLSLLEQEDFTEASFLLTALGEGTFLDLLRFIEQHAPDEVTAEIARRARTDETRHVHFGLSHLRHALACDPGLFARLETAVRRRAATLAGVTSLPAPTSDALVILAAGSIEPSSVARGHEALRTLLDDMHESRVKRLLHAGFSEEQASTLSSLHTPNIM